MVVFYDCQAKPRDPSNLWVNIQILKSLAESESDEAILHAVS